LYRKIRAAMPWIALRYRSLNASLWLKYGQCVSMLAARKRREPF
jgi:hypothetical protein